MLQKVITNQESGINADMVVCLAEFTQMTAEVDSQVLMQCRYLNDIMTVFRESAVNVHQKNLNNQLILSLVIWLLEGKHQAHKA
jgi:hypothetical protein